MGCGVALAETSYLSERCVVKGLLGYDGSLRRTFTRISATPLKRSYNDAGMDSERVFTRISVKHVFQVATVRILQAHSRQRVNSSCLHLRCQRFEDFQECQDIRDFI